MKRLVFSLALFWSAAALANHNYAGLDLCSLYPEIMPPGMKPADLPQPQSPGAHMLQTYCEQCHSLPGPGRHTAEEWTRVLDNMNNITVAASQFNGFLGKVIAPGKEELEVLETYLKKNALQPMTEKPHGIGASAFEVNCSQCHALPDARQHNAGEWSNILKRMQHNMTVMKHTPPTPEQMLQIQFYLQQQLDKEKGGVIAVVDSISTDDDSDLSSTQSSLNAERGLALGPFMLLMFAGVIRLIKGRNKS